MDVELTPDCRARPYRGPVDHAVMAAILSAYRRHHSDNEQPTAEQFDTTYAHLANCDPYRDAWLLEVGGATIGYGRTSWEDHHAGLRSWVPFAVIHPDHLTEARYTAFVRLLEDHASWMPAGERPPDQFLAFAPHPGPDLPADGEAGWLEAMGYRPFRFGATLVRPHLDDIPDVRLPDGVELRSVEPHHIRPIWDAHWEAFRGQWDFREATDEDFRAFVDNPELDPSLWKIVWAGDQVVGQVKSHIIASENEAEGRRRGYTEEISTHAAWRGRGIAGALVCESLHELRRRGMTEAALGADTENPSAFGLYQRLGFVVTSYEAVYTKPR